jgi:Domain of unknown function (DUF4105)
MSRTLHWAGLLLLGGVLAAVGAWSALALANLVPGEGKLRSALVAAVSLATIVAVVALALPRWRWRGVAGILVVFAAVLVRFFAVEPSNDRDWQMDVAVLPRAEIEGNLVTVRNVRNFDYRSETDYTPAHDDRHFDLDTLVGVDLVAAYWMGPAIAHTFLSFEFADGQHLAISIETRKEKGEGYSTVKGFFRQYELHYVVADERDVIRLRTNYRRDPPEDVYVYRIQGPTDNGRKVFLAYMEQINALALRPAFYNTLSGNCTVEIWFNTLTNSTHLPFSWKLLASGYVPEYLHETGRLDTGVPFAILQRRAHVNARAQAADAAPDFSKRIRTEAPR